MNILVLIFLGSLVMLALGAYFGAAVKKPAAGVFLTMFLGPVGWIILFIWAREDEKVKQAGLNSANKDPGQMSRANNPKHQ
jgi:K+ transporter